MRRDSPPIGGGGGLPEDPYCQRARSETRGHVCAACRHDGMPGEVIGTEATAAAWTLTRIEEEHAQLLRLLDPVCLYRQVAEELRQATGLDIAMVAPVDENGRVVLRYFSGALGR